MISLILEFFYAIRIFGCKNMQGGPFYETRDLLGQL